MLIPVQVRLAWVEWTTKVYINERALHIVKGPFIYKYGNKECGSMGV